VSPSVLPLVSPCYKSISVFGYSLCCYKRRKSRDGGRSTNGRHASLSPHILYMNFDDNEEGIENTMYLGMMGLDWIVSVVFSHNARHSIANLAL